MKKLKTTVLSGIVLFGLNLSAQSFDATFWLPANEAAIKQTGKRQIVPQKYKTVSLNADALKNKLFAAPNEKAVRINQSSCIILLPLPNGTQQRFLVVESPIMAPELAAAYPQIKTFSVKGIDDPYANGKLDWNDFGFHGMVRSINGDFFIDPYCVGNVTDYITYYTSDFEKDPSLKSPEIGLIKNGVKTTEEHQGIGLKTANTNPAICVGAQLSTYRLAVTCTGEYAVAATGLGAPTVQQTLAKIVTSVNRVDGVYEKEVAVRMVLVPTETTVIYTNPNTDPFTANNNGSALLGESQTEITGTIGTADFDIGHIFSTGGGGIAQLGCVCDANSKAQGVTGSPSPVGDPYDIDYVAHEMGHQFDSNHPFNAVTGSCGGGNRNATTAVEPGSGITIMGYAGICGANDLALHSIAYFHAISYDEIVNFTNSGNGAGCAAVSATGNQPPQVNGLAGYVVPVSTPFYLSGTASDPDPTDSLTYSWEEIDLGTGGGGNWNSGSRPFFRSYNPTASSTRYFPNQTVVLSGNYTGTKGEYLPTTPQTLNFRLTARDNKMGGGGVCYSVNNVTIDNSGPFLVTNPSTVGIVWNSGTQQTVTWDVNGTDVAPINCSFVNILISYDSGNTYTTLVTSVLNDGVEQVTAPTVTASISTCRIKVECATSVFYDIGNNNFTIAAYTNTTSVGISPISQNNPVGLTVWPNPTSGQLNLSAVNLTSQSPTQVTVMDVLGKVVMQSTYTNKTELKESIDLSGVGKGFYFIKVNNDEKQAVYRILKD